MYDGRYEIPTLQEVIDLAERLGVGIYPETQHSTYFRSLGKPLEEPLVRTLRANGLDDEKDPVFVQSFETENLQALGGPVPTRRTRGSGRTRPAGCRTAHTLGSRLRRTRRLSRAAAAPTPSPPVTR